jgi:predicted GIY-YIG superfamily endonuclease
MHYVYLLRRLSHPDQTYIGCSSDLKDRLQTHNAGVSPDTSKYVPWKLVTYLAFDDKQKAIDFEA